MNTDSSSNNRRSTKVISTIKKDSMKFQIMNNEIKTKINEEHACVSVSEVIKENNS